MYSQLLLMVLIILLLVQRKLILISLPVLICQQAKIQLLIHQFQSLLQTERLMLNIMQRMSGIATMTNRYVKKLEGTKTRVLDTRKTTPGMRILEKMAVKIGGGCNHRIGLFDMILLKDNHVDFSGGIHNAVTRAKEYCKAKGKNLKIELEVRNFDEHFYFHGWIETMEHHLSYFNTS